jgi:hypothetical protein
MRCLGGTFGFATLLLASSGLADTLEVGPGKTYATPCAAFVAAQAGDVVEIDAAGNGTYDGDVCGIGVDNLTIRGVNGLAHVDADGQSAQGKAIWVVQGDDVTLENVELSGAEVPDLNGAGIRAEGTNLTIRGSYFHDNQEGILGGAGELLIESTEFARNGNCIDPSGCAHNMYISASVTKFTLQYCYSHSVTDGHLVKSRAQENYILYNRLTGEDGTDSYEINLPNAGTSYVIGNLIEQGQNTGNSAILDYGSEGASNPGNDLYVINNTFVNDRPSGGIFVSIDESVTVPAVVRNNVFSGTGELVSQSNAELANNFSGANPLLVDATNFDYRLTAGSPCAEAGVDPGEAAGGFSLLPVAHYVHPLSHEARATVGVIDIGAYELGGENAGTGGSAGAGNAGTSGNVARGGSSGVGGSSGAGTGGSAAGAGAAAGGNPGAGSGGAAGGSAGAAAQRACPQGSSGCEDTDCSCAVPGVEQNDASRASALLLLLGFSIVRRRLARRPEGRNRDR